MDFSLIKIIYSSTTLSVPLEHEDNLKGVQRNIATNTVSTHKNISYNLTPFGSTVKLQGTSIPRLTLSRTL